MEYLFPVNDVDAGFDVGKVVGDGEDGLPLVLLVEFSVGIAIRGEGSGEDEAH